MSTRETVCKTAAYLLSVLLLFAACTEEAPPDPDPPTCTDGLQNGIEIGVDCGGSCPVCVTPSGNRLLGINPSPSRNGDDFTAFAKVQSTGANAVSIGWGWNELEELPEAYQVAKLDHANSVYAVPGFKIVVMVNPIETDIRALPYDLEGLAFDDPIMIARFKALLDNVFERLSDLEIDALLIGNEVNGYLQDHPDQFAAYQALYEAASAHAKSRRPGIKVGAQVLWEGLLTDFSSENQALNTTSDVIALTYYPSTPVEDRFGIPDLTVIEQDMADLTAAYAAREIYIIECGYSSSTILNSSQQEQADFVREVFRVWDIHDSQIRLVSFFLLHDYDREWIIELLAALGIDGHPNYEDVLEGFTTLGLRTYEGEDKLAFSVLVEEAVARGW